MVEKKLPDDLATKRALIEPDHPDLSIRRQCALIGLHRVPFYYHPVPEIELNLHLMRLIGEQHLRPPFYGWPRLTMYLQQHGYAINHKRVQRLMRLMGRHAVYPKPCTTSASPEQPHYPYLWRHLAITHHNQGWSADITYIPLTAGFRYLVAVIDWYSRYVVAWQLSNTLDGHFCLVTLAQALDQGAPEIFNPDQGGNSPCGSSPPFWKVLGCA